MEASFSPRDKVLRFQSHWWVIAAAAIIGGMIGMTIFAIKQPVYEARVTLTMGINFARTGILEQYDKDLALGTAAGIIFSADVIQQVVDAANQNNISIDYDTLKNSSVMERKTSQWILKVRAGNPDEAAFLANQWIDIGLEQLNQAYQHALTANSLQDYADALEMCIEQMAVNAAVPVCPYSTAPQLQAALAETSTLLIAEKQASRNLFPEMTFHVDQFATKPEKPVQYGRNNLVIAGLLIGMLVGMGLSSTRLPELMLKKK